MRRGFRAALLGFALIATVVSGQAAAFAQESTPAASPMASPTSACAETTRNTMEKVARTWHEDVFAAKDPTLLEPYLSPDAVRHSVVFPEAVGSAAVERVLTNVLTGFPDARGKVDFVLVDAPYAAASWTVSGTNTGEFEGMAATGRQATWHGLDIYRFECGKVVESWTEVDQLGRLQQLGLLPMPQATPVAATPAALAPAASPVACGTTSADQGATAVQLMWDDVWSAGNLDALNDIVTPNVIHHWAIGPDSIGPAATADRIAGLRAAFPDLTITYGPLIQDGDYVAATWVIKGTHKGAYLGIAPTGNPIDATGINIFRFECGRIAEVWSEMDAITMLQQMGAMPAAPEATPGA
ncbi:MAG TPA: ester cyclase family protein [Thermomicrobiales bacterium]|nr:ester cyclase family protein [Thermomicrobiales bacterium]